MKAGPASAPSAAGLRQKQPCVSRRRQRPRRALPSRTRSENQEGEGGRAACHPAAAELAPSPPPPKKRAPSRRTSLLHLPFRGRGILGAGVQRQMISLGPSCLCPPGVLTPAGGDSGMRRCASAAALTADIRFLDDAVRRGEGEWPASAAVSPVGDLNCWPRFTWWPTGTPTASMCREAKASTWVIVAGGAGRRRARRRGGRGGAAGGPSGVLHLHHHPSREGRWASSLRSRVRGKVEKERARRFKGENNGSGGELHLESVYV